MTPPSSASSNGTSYTPHFAQRLLSLLCAHDSRHRPYLHKLSVMQTVSYEFLRPQYSFWRWFDSSLREFPEEIINSMSDRVLAQTQTPSSISSPRDSPSRFKPSNRARRLSLRLGFGNSGRDPVVYGYTIILPLCGVQAPLIASLAPTQSATKQRYASALCCVCMYVCQ